MKLRISIWVSVIIVCVGLGLWQRKNLDTIWREYTSLHRHIKYDDYSMNIRGPLIPPKVAKEDPEAAAIVEVCLGRPYRKADERIKTVAEKLIELPNNEFLLFELVRYLCEDDRAVDPQITLRFVERLIALEPDNANYRYIKCYFLLADRHGNNIDTVIEEIEHANQYKEYGFPYYSYKQRAIDIANKAKLSRFLTTELGFSIVYNPATSDVWRQLIEHASVAFTDGDTAKGMRITNVLVEMQERQLRDGDPHARSSMSFSVPYIFGHWQQPQGLELQRVNLTKERARNNRLQLCTLMTSRKKPAERNKSTDEKEKKEKEERRIASLAVPPAVHSGEMFIACLWGSAILLLISAARSFGGRNKLRFLDTLLFIVGCVFYFCIAKGFFLVSLLDNLCCFSYIDALRPTPIGWEIIEFESMLAALFLAGPIVAALALWGLGFLRPKKGAFWRFWYIRVLLALIMGAIAAFITFISDYSSIEGVSWQRCAIASVLVGVLAWVIITFAWWLFRWRIIRLFLLAIFFGSVTILASGYRYIHYLPMIVFVLAGATMAVVKPNEGSAFKTMLRLFSRKPDVAAIRNKCLKLTAPFVVVYWVLFIALTPLLTKSIDLEFREFKPVDRRVILPDPNEAYRELMSRFDAEELSKTDIYRLLGLVMPEDLPALLQKLKNKEFADPYYLPLRGKGADEEEKSRLERMRLNDGDLVLAMRGCGRDTVGIITGFLDNPDAEQALVARARLGDLTTKEKLEELLQTKMQNELDKKEDNQAEHPRTYLDIPARASEIIGALACISEPNEAAQRFLDYIQNREISDLMEEHQFFEGLTLLPTPYAHRVIKSYLDKTHSWQPREEKMPWGLFRESPDRVLYPLRNTAGFYGDRQIAEEFFEIMLSAANEDRTFDSHDISPYFENQSAELLKKGLSSSNTDMRAWCVWQLRKIGYKFPIPELEKLLKDESWKVRTNAFFAGGKEAGDLAKNDNNALVRLVAGF